LENSRTACTLLPHVSELARQIHIEPLPGSNFAAASAADHDEPAPAPFPQVLEEGARGFDEISCIIARQSVGTDSGIRTLSSFGNAFGIEAIALAYGHVRDVCFGSVPHHRGDLMTA
jgi:hypothetical protein